MKFTPIDFNSWPRGQMFHYFSRMAPTGYSMTVNVDITKLKAAAKANGLKFFPIYLWLVTKNLNSQIEFKVAEQDGCIGYFDTLTPLYSVFHDDDKTISLMWTEYSDDFSEFYSRYLKNQKEFSANHGVLSQPQTLPPANTYTVACNPWVTFTHFAVHSYENKPYYFPSFEGGKFFEQDGRLMMPLSITCHHATTDGYHISTFLKSLQVDMDNFENHLSQT